MASTYFNNFQLQQNKLPGMGLYGMPPFYGEFYGNFYGKNFFPSSETVSKEKSSLFLYKTSLFNLLSEIQGYYADS
jgi:hypothetical protein